MDFSVYEIKGFLIENKIADAYQHLLSCNGKLELIDYNVDILNHIIKNYEKTTNLEHRQLWEKKMSSDEIYEYMKENSERIYCMNIGGKKVKTMMEIQSRFTLLLGLLHSFFDIYSKWINCSLLAEEGISNDCDLTSLVKCVNKKRETFNMHINFLRNNVLGLKQSNEYRYINDLNNIVKHQKNIKVEETPLINGNFVVTIPNFKRTSYNNDYTHDRVVLIEEVLKLTTYCHEIMTESVQYIGDYYLHNQCPFVKNRRNVESNFRVLEDEIKGLSEVKLLYVNQRSNIIQNMIKDELDVFSNEDECKKVGILKAKFDLRTQYKEVVNEVRNYSIEIPDKSYNDFEIKYVSYVFVLD